MDNFCTKKIKKPAYAVKPSAKILVLTASQPDTPTRAFKPPSRTCAGRFTKEVSLQNPSTHAPVLTIYLCELTPYFWEKAAHCVTTMIIWSPNAADKQEKSTIGTQYVEAKSKNYPIGSANVKAASRTNVICLAVQKCKLILPIWELHPN